MKEDQTGYGKPYIHLPWSKRPESQVMLIAAKSDDADRNRNAMLALQKYQEFDQLKQSIDNSLEAVLKPKVLSSVDSP